MQLAKTYGMLRSLAVYYGQFWRRGRLESFYSQFLQPGDLAFDIGSHVGNRTRAWRRMGVRVVAVEPQPDFFRLLQRLFGRDPEVALEACGVASRSGQGTLFISSATPTVSTCTASFVEEASTAERFSSVRWDEERAVDLCTLEQLIERHGLPRFCKIDIEGGEEEALQGLQTAIPALSFECVGAMSTRAQRCVDRLEELGSYEYRYSRLETMQWLQSRWLTAAEMKEFLGQMPENARAGDVYARTK